MLQENNLAVCLKTGMLDNLPPRTRQSKVAKTAEWRALDKPWKSLLLICLHEIQIPDEEEGTSSPICVEEYSVAVNKRRFRTP